METTPPVGISTQALPNCAGCQKRKKLQIVAIVTGAIASLTVLFLMYKGESLDGHRVWMSVSAPKHAAIAIGPYPASPITLLKNDGSYFPSTMAISGKDLYIVDAAHVSQNKTLLIAIEPTDKPTSNLYQENASGEVTQLTTSQTAKYELSVDVTTGRALYVVLALQTVEDLFKKSATKITMYDPATSKESVVAEGSRPHFLNGGDTFMYENGGSLRIHSLVSKSDGVVLSLAHLGAYTLDANSSHLFIYNVLTHAVDRYTIVNGMSLSYDSSLKTVEYPKVLGYFEGALYVVSGGEATTTPHTLLLEKVETHEKSIITTSVAGWPQRAYDYVP